MVIVSWILDGTLRHEAADGVSTAVHPGSVQVLSTGPGIEHGEHADADAATRFVQMALLAGHDAAVDYSLDAITDGALAPATSVRTPAGVATLSVVRPADGPVLLPAPSWRFVFVTRGVLTVGSGGRAVDLRAGDSARTTAAGPLELSGPAGSAVQGEALVWDLPQ